MTIIIYYQTQLLPRKEWNYWNTLPRTVAAVQDNIGNSSGRVNL